MKSDLTNETRRASSLKMLTRGFALLLVMGVLASMVFVTKPESVSATTVSFSQCNNRNAGPGGAPLTVICQVNIVNNITPNGNSSTVTFTRSCTLNPCSGDTVNSSDVVNAVHQCNGSDNVGGSRTICSVNIVNNISLTPAAAPTAITLSQCIGSGAGGGTNMTGCAPSSQGSPTVTQCNGSGNGGGGSMTCSAFGTTSSAFLVTVDQCNGSENGGGSFVTCIVSITNNISQTPPATATQAGAATATQAAGATVTATPTIPAVFFQTPPGAFFQSPFSQFVQPGLGGFFQPAPGVSAQPQAGAIIQPAPAAFVQPTPGIFVQPQPGAFVQRPPVALVQPPQAGDAGLLQHARSKRPAGGIAFTAVFLLGAIALACLLPRKGQA